MHIAQNLKFLRKRKGKSQEEMAQALGLIDLFLRSVGSVAG